MVEEVQQYPVEAYYNDPISKIADIDGKQRILKEKMNLILKNVIELKEKNVQETLEIKKQLEQLKQNVSRMILFIETASQEFSKFAKKEDLEILAKQAKMFQPLEFVRRDELKWEH